MPRRKRDRAQRWAVRSWSSDTKKTAAARRLENILNELEETHDIFELDTAKELVVGRLRSPEEEQSEAESTLPVRSFGSFEEFVQDVIKNENGAPEEDTSSCMKGAQTNQFLAALASVGQFLEFSGAPVAFVRPRIKQAVENIFQSSEEIALTLLDLQSILEKHRKENENCAGTCITERITQLGIEQLRARHPKTPSSN